ncbi:hypothetical protein BD410DRAFT_782657 [Rickenella mellea]|uniref:RlpA-like protein double-psi beta-barrel domain-containing protein n=1 Tax=Rickenella mellea TaxID=50990 RepID=A0A4Y7QK08_9AGAM|nr:hypothetical protein BD410DRAFT_782657 [Rickenella mellea]
MRFTTLVGVSLLTVTLPFTALAGSHDTLHRRHHDIAKRASGDVQLHKRFSNARFTFYDVGLGACGIYNKPSDFIVALNSAQFGGGYPGPNCFKEINICYNGKCTGAQITDECPGCPFGGLDLSRGLFDFFASEDLGVLYGSWTFGGGGGGGGDPPPAPKPKPKPTPHNDPPPPPPTTTHHKSTPPPPPPPKTTSSPPKEDAQPKTTSTKSDPTTTYTSTATPNLTQGAGAGLAEATGGVVQQGGPANNNNLLNSAVIGMGSLIVAGAKSNNN